MKKSRREFIATGLGGAAALPFVSRSDSGAKGEFATEGCRTVVGNWARHGVRSEVSGYNANTVDDLQGLKSALFAAGADSVWFRDYRYRALA